MPATRLEPSLCSTRYYIPYLFKDSDNLHKYHPAYAQTLTKFWHLASAGVCLCVWKLGCCLCAAVPGACSSAEPEGSVQHSKHGHQPWRLCSSAPAPPCLWGVASHRALCPCVKGKSKIPLISSHFFQGDANQYFDACGMNDWEIWINVWGIWGCHGSAEVEVNHELVNHTDWKAWLEPPAQWGRREQILYIWGNPGCLRVDSIEVEHLQRKMVCDQISKVHHRAVMQKGHMVP